MDIVLIAEQIEKYILRINREKDKLPELAKRKAETLAEYEKQLAITILRLKNGDIYSFEGQEIGNLPVTLIEKTAKGICWKEKLDAELAEANYKVAITNIQALEAQLNGYQSLYKYLREEV